MESVRLFSLLFFVAGSYLWMQAEDYHEKFDKTSEVYYNCDIVQQRQGPPEALKQCLSSDRDIVWIRTYR
jgi:hypothetical protein